MAEIIDIIAIITLNLNLSESEGFICSSKNTEIVNLTEDLLGT
jgi:uncharacterized protein YbcI